MNMAVLGHEYKGGLHSDISFGDGVWVNSGGVDLTYLFASSLFEPFMGLRHCTSTAAL